MPRKRRRQPPGSTATPRVGESPDTAAHALPVRGSAVRYSSSELFPDAPRLSEREWETLELAADGKSNGVIATAFGNSKRTVEDFIANIVRKLDVADRDEAKALYYRAIEAKLHGEIAQRDAQIRALENRVAALRRQLRTRS